MDRGGQEGRRGAAGTDAAAAAARALHARLAALRAEVAAGAAARLAAWGVAPSAGAGAGAASGGAAEVGAAALANLADYLALRDADLRPLQGPLAALGLSSLGRAEAHVAASLAAVSAALARVAGLAPEPFPPAAAFSEGRARIAAATAALFGSDAGGPATRILATLPPEAASAPALLEALLDAGVTAVRINSAHDSPEVWRALAAAARSAGARAGRPVPVVMDLAGPKVRLLAIEGAEDRRFFRGEIFALASSPAATFRRPCAILSHPGLLARLAPGMEVWIDDGKLRSRVLEAGPEAAVLEVAGTRDKGARLRPGKGVVIPGVDIDIPALTEADLASLDVVAATADVVGFSFFVQRPADVEALVAALDARRGSRPRPAILLKIETGLALRNLPELIVAAAAAGPVAVMIARGDLAVSLGFERLSEVQDEILWLCEAAHVPVVWATQVLDGLLHEGLPTRAETTDAAMSQRADCVMLNKGPHLVEAVAFLRDVLQRMARHQDKKSARLGPLHAWSLRRQPHGQARG